MVFLQIYLPKQIEKVFFSKFKKHVPILAILVRKEVTVLLVKQHSTHSVPLLILAKD